ncbi:hypothetical protein HPULCUR_004588 [Helicostylum pulchrum]|uniref:Uncharacterized protein n=1 Tax=Helicostylum pulchrum TaxID=562976 RepID=A0ABP9XY10_9FUNG
MGQTVGGYSRNRRRESFSSCVSNFDSATSSSSSSSSSLESQKKANTSSTEDDVTPQSLFPYTTSANSPSNSDEPSMSSSIIETSSVKEETHKGTRHVSGLASKIIPKRAWSGYHLFQLTNMRGERIHSSPRVIRSPKIRPKSNTMDSPNTTNTGEEDIDQLITMMKNHKVSDDSPFDFNFNNAKPLTPQPSPQQIPATTTNSTTFTPSSEFKFSFSANIPPTTASSTTAFTADTITNEPNYIKVREIYREVDREEDEEEDDEEEEEEQGEQDEPKAEQDQNLYDPHLNRRKILPLPKPRLKKSSNIPTTTVTNNNHNTLTETTTIPDLDNKSIDDQKPDNKRKERNWRDNFTKHPIIPPPPPAAAEAAAREFKKPEKPPTPVAVVVVEKRKKAAAAAAAAASASAARKKKGKGLAEDSLLMKQQQQKKKNTKSRQKKKEDEAPGGFLSSDINLFQNPIPEDWICLFCQYDILFSGMTEARKKNGYYRRKKERSRRAREAEVRRMGSLCYSDVDHDT